MTVRRLRLIATFAAAALLAACGAEPPPPPPPPTPAPVALPAQLLNQAATYEDYVAKAGALNGAFTDPTQVAASLRVGAAYQAEQLLQGAIAYGAIAALQEPSFVATFRPYALHPTERKRLVKAMLADPSYVALFDGAPRAAGRVAAALGGDGRRIFAAGQAVRQSAYDIQRQPWSKAAVENRDQRLADAKTLSSTPQTGTVAEIARLQQAAEGRVPLGGFAAASSPPYATLVLRSLTLAAMAAMGEGADENLVEATEATRDPIAGRCLTYAKLNLYQCLAVAKPHYEDVFCLGQHALMDTGQCVIQGAGASQPLTVAANPPLVPSATPATAASDAAQPDLIDSLISTQR